MPSRKGKEVRLKKRETKKVSYVLEGFSLRDFLSKKLRGILRKELKGSDVLLLALGDVEERNVLLLGYLSPESFEKGVVEVSALGEEPDTLRERFMEGVERLYK